MLYEKYKRRMTKVSSVWGWIKSFRVLLIAIGIFLVLFTGAFVSTKGILLSENTLIGTNDAPLTLSYGEKLDYKVNALFTKVEYEYAELGSSEWGITAPRSIGTYQVRAKSKGFFATHYTKPQVYQIVPKALDISVLEKTQIYGDELTLVGEVQFDDVITCSSFHYEHLTEGRTQVTPENDAIKIINSQQDDVSSSYSISVTPSIFRFIKREITVEVADKSAVYDGNPFSSAHWEITDGSLANNDTLNSEFENELTNVGAIENTATFGVTNSEGVDMSLMYDIKTKFGKLIVTKRPIYISSKSATKVYDGQPLFLQDYTVSSEVPLVDGDELQLLSSAELTNAGETDNLFSFRVLGNNGDVTNNYEFLYTDVGVLSVTPKSATVTTDSGLWEYDGQGHSYDSYTASGIIDGHTVSTNYLTIITDVGTADNAIAVKIYDKVGDITANYKFQYYYGELEITPLEVTVETFSNSWTYDGSGHSDGSHITNNIAVGHRSVAYGSLATITNVGSADNAFAIRIFDGGRDVTANYSITGYIYGKLEIFHRYVAVTTNSYTWEYDGKAHYYDKHSVSNIVKTHTSKSIGECATITDIGKTPNVFAIRILDGTKDVTSNYVITEYTYGELEVTKRNITVTTNSHSWKYDGEEHSDTGYKITVGSILDIHTGRQSGEHVKIKNVGSISNEFEIKIFNGDNNDVTSDYYVITYIYGELKITPRKITVTTGSQKWTYDGQEHYCDSYSVANLVSGHTKAIFGDLTKIKDVGTIENVFAITVYDGGIDVAYNYDITYIYGELEVTPRKVTVTTASHTWIYDGEEHADENHSTSNLIDGHTTLVYILTAIKDVGSKKNFLAIRIYDGFVNVTSNYEISYIDGTLRVTPLEITVRPKTNIKSYDGTPIRAVNYEIVDSTKMPDGSRIQATYKGSQTIIGSSESEIASIKIFSGNIDVTANYKISLEKGTLIVTKRNLILTAGSAEKVYDTTPLTSSQVLILGDGLLSGHKLYAPTSGSITYPGSVPNYIADGSIAITASGKDVLDYYDITTYEGSLVVYQRQITIITANAEKAHDGQPLTCDEYVILGELADGHRMLVVVTGTITDIGSTPNIAEVLDVLDQANNDIRLGYEIEYNLGILTIYDTDKGEGIGVGDGSGGAGGGNISTDGTINREGSSDGAGGYPVLFYATSNTSHFAYFRVKSFGDYNEDGWLNADPYLSGSFNANKLAQTALENGGKQLNRVYVDPVNANLLYMVPYYAQGGYLNNNDVMQNLPVGSRYAFEYISYEYNSQDSFSVPSNYAAFEQAYYEYVTSTYLQLPAETKSFLLDIAAVNGLVASDPKLVENVTSFVQNKVKYDLNFEEYVGDISTYFFSQAKTGICQHYATAATTLFRALGIPARYTVGYAAELMAGRSVSVSGKTAHAWVEVYLKGMGWVQLEVTGSGALAFEGEAKEEESADLMLSIRPIDVSKQFDGSPLFAQNNIVGIDSKNNLALEALLSIGYTYSVEVSGSRTELGNSASEIAKFVLYDPFGKNITSRYKIFYFAGKIRVYNNPIEIHVFEKKKVYDGKPLSYGADDYWVENLPTGYRLEFKLSGSITEVGEFRFADIEDVLPFTLRDESGNNVSDNYSLVFYGKPLEISMRSIEITSESVTRLYDGKPLTGSNAKISKGSLPQGYTYEFWTQGEITEIGKVENWIVAVNIFDSKGNDTSYNFAINTVNGILTII